MALAGRAAPWRRARRLRNAGLDFAVEHRRECSTLRDQFSLGLLDQLVLIDLEKIEAEQRQRQHGGQHQKDHEAEARPPFSAGRVQVWRFGQRAASQRPSLKPTPWTVSITDSQPQPPSWRGCS